MFVDSVPMTETGGSKEIRWLRVPVDKEILRALTRRTDWEGFLQVVPFLAIISITGGVTWLAWGRQPWFVVVPLLFLHGTCSCFMLNGFHELVHGTVFKTRALNSLFLWMFSFLGWSNPVAFRASHMKHHLNTLHPPYDLEVVLPIQLTPAGFLLSGFVDLIGLFGIRDMS